MDSNLHWLAFAHSLPYQAPPKLVFTRATYTGLAAFSESLFQLNTGEQDRQLITDSVLSHPKNGPATINTRDLDITEKHGEIILSNRLSDQGFIIKGTFVELREEWEQNKNMYEHAVALYETLVEKNDDLFATGEGAVEMVETIQAQVNEGTKQDEIMALALEKLAEFCPLALQIPAKAKEFIKCLIELTSSPLAEVGRKNSELGNSRENPVQAFVKEVRHLTRLNQPVFGFPPETDVHIVDYLDQSSLQTMRLVSIAAHNEVQRRINWRLDFDTRFQQEKTHYWCDYFEQINVPTLMIKLDNLYVRPNKWLISQFIASLAKNKHVKAIQLDISGSQLGIVSHALSNITEALVTLPNLTTLNIGHNFLGRRDVKLISSLMQIKSLNIDRNNLMDDGAEELISSMPNLTNLTIINNQLSPHAQKFISAMPNLTSEVGEVMVWKNYFRI